MRPHTLKSALAVTGIAAAFVALSIGVFQIDRHEKQNMKTASVVVSSASVVSSENTDNVLTDSVTLVSPFTEYGSREDACAAAETSLDAPDSVPGFAGTRYEAASASEMVQITYGTASPDTGEIMIRKAPGSGDISGNSIPYDEERTLTVGDRQVSVRSTAGQVFVATWEENGYAYALCCQTGLDTETASSLISEVE